MIGVRNKSEIEKIKKACIISAGSLKAAGNAVKEGATTADVDKAVYNYIVSKGAKPNFKGYNGFSGSACVSINDEVIHGIPSSKRVLKAGDIIAIDTGATIDGWHGDNAYTFTVGDVSEEAEKLLKVTEESLYKGIEAAVIGNRIGDIGYAVQNHVEAAGFSVVREFIGHGIGRALHEDPEVPNFGKKGRGVRLVEGMVICIEPMVNQKSHKIYVMDDGWTVRTRDGGLSAHFEHTIAITKDGPQILTKAE